MAGVPAFISDGPLWGLFVFLFIVVFFRAQGTYWVGRLARHGGERSRWSARFNSHSLTRAQDYLDRWGPVGVPISFLTVGFQTMVNAAAGFGRMNWLLYTAAMIPGCVIWSLVYTLAGLSVWAAAARLGSESPWLLAAGLAVLAIVAGGAIWWRHRNSPESDRVKEK